MIFTAILNSVLSTLPNPNARGDFYCTHASTYVWARQDFQVCVGQSDVIASYNGFAWASGASISITTGDCNPCKESPDLDVDFGPGSAEAVTLVCYQVLGRGAHGGGGAYYVVTDRCISGYINAGASSSMKSGNVCCAGLYDFGTALDTGSGASGIVLEFEIESGAELTSWFSPPPPVYRNSSTKRSLAVNILTLGGEMAMYSAFIAGDGVHEFVENLDPVILSPGVHNMVMASMSVEDTEDDVTGDGRFNQADVDFLSSLVGTPDATDPAYARFDIVRDPNSSAYDGIQDIEIAIFQALVDTGLTSGYLGDADGDGLLTCADLALALAQPFAGEAFPSSSYSVRLDANLDGINDATDKAAVGIALLEVEPANFHFDGNMNSFDLYAFMALYTAEDPLADMAPPYGVFNFFDLDAFLDAFDSPECL